MEFADDREHALAILISIRYLPPLIRGFEDALLDAGFEIVSRRHEPGARMPTPVLALRRDGRDLDLHMGNAIEDFLFADREAEPLRVDPQLADPEYAEWKLRDIVEARVALLDITLMPDGDQKDRRMTELAGRFAWIRIARRESGDDS